MRSLSIDGTRAYYAVGECEGEVPVSHFETTAPQTRTVVMSPSISTGFDIVATDGNRIYVSNSGADWDYSLNGSYTTFITAHNVSDNSEYAFPSGTDVTKDSTHTYHGCIDINTWVPPLPKPPQSYHTQDNPNQPTGMAVQKGATGILAVAHGGPGGPSEVRLFDKVSGTQLPQRISIANPQNLAMDSAGDLWVISGTSLVRYTNLKTTPMAIQTITGFNDPVAVAVSPVNPDLMLVADGGSADLVRAFNRTATSIQNQLWTFGTPGGWDTNGPDVIDSIPKFRFSVGGYGDVHRIALAVEADGSFRVADGATSRLLHVNSAHNGIIDNDTVMFLTFHNWTAVDPQYPRRVIGDGWLEFDVDYTKPIQSAWTLKKNWAAGLDTYFKTGPNIGNALNAVMTLSNGHVYGTISDSTPFAYNQRVVVELPENTPNTPLRVCKDTNGGTLMLGIDHQAPDFGDFQQPKWLSPDGAIRYPKWSRVTGGAQIEFWEMPLTGFDGTQNPDPRWGPEALIASAPYTELDPSSINDVENIAYPQTTSNKIVIFEPQIAKADLNGGPAFTASGFHLGAITRGDTLWSWRASPAVTADLPFDGRGSFDLGDSCNIAGIVVKGSDHHLIYSYPGEFWNGSEASQWMHFYDDGLFVGQFGTSGDYGNGFVGARPGFSGNSNYPTLVDVDDQGMASDTGDLYLYSNDETDHSGVIRWHILGANAIREQSGTGLLGAAIQLQGAPATFPTGLTAVPGNGKVSLTWNSAGAGSTYTVKEATASGGPYTSVASTSLTHKVINGLSNGVEYFFVVSANATLVNSNQTQAFPFDTIGIAGQMTGGLPGAKLEALAVSSTAPPSQPALVGLNPLFGNLSKNNVGSKGYVIYNWAGGGNNTSSTPVPYTVTTNTFSPFTAVNLNTTAGVSDWFNQNAGASSQFVINGQLGSDQNPCLNLHQGANGSVDITVSDNAVHYLTVFSPDIANNPRSCTVTLAPLGLSSPSASYTINEVYGVNHVFQFSFIGNVTLRYSNVSGPFNSEGGGLQALFLD